MGVDVMESELAGVSVTAGNEENISLKENGASNNTMVVNEPIKFGSHGTDDALKGEVTKAPEVNFPKDAVEEWPAPKQIYSFYFVKFRSFEDQKLKAKLDQADKELQKKNQARLQITEKLRAKRGDRSQVINQLKSLGEENKQFRSVMDEKRKEMEPLQQALGKLRGPNSRERGSSLCSSEEELNGVIKSLQYRIQHESIPLSEEKQILREIKQLEGTREAVIKNAAMRAEIQVSMGEKEVIQDQVKLIGVGLDGVRKEQQVVKGKLKQLEDEKNAIDREIKLLEEELNAITEKRDKTFESIREYRKQREEGNSSFYQNRTIINKARDLAAKKDIEALKELSDSEITKFVSLWAESKSFREDYEKRILSSLDIRQLSKDGRMRNADEKPLLAPVAPTPAENEVVLRAPVKQAKDDLVSPPQDDASSVQKAQKEKSAKQPKEANKKVKGNAMELRDLEDEEEIFVIEKKELPKKNDVDEAKLKEMKREEELAKAKQAMERKKKLAEKAAVKAAIKAQKEAEKKLKEREKKAKKKAGAVVAAQDTEESTEAAAEVAEPEKVEEKVDTPALPKKDRKENVVRHRTRPRGQDSLPKAILKRKKATNYWLWAAPAALVALILVVVAYYYLL